jgi:tetratricopeptide (TPR) repeat protein
LLNEATQAYSQGIAKSQTDSAHAKELLSTASRKYQLLVDSGIHNAKLFTNLGNVYLQTGKLGHAIANYERVLQFDPGNRQVLKNLAFANEKIKKVQMASHGDTGYLRSLNKSIVDVVGVRPVIWTLALTSLAFWGLMILRVVHRQFPIWKCAAAPLALLLISLGSVALTQSNAKTRWNAVIVADSVSIYAGDGEQFEEVVSIDAAQGQRVEVLARRGSWSQVLTTQGHRGWVHLQDVESYSFIS